MYIQQSFISKLLILSNQKILAKFFFKKIIISPYLFFILHANLSQIKLVIGKKKKKIILVFQKFYHIARIFVLIPKKKQNSTQKSKINQKIKSSKFSWSIIVSVLISFVSDPYSMLLSSRQPNWQPLHRHRERLSKMGKVKIYKVPIRAYSS